VETGVATHSNVYLIASYICVKWNKITPYLLTQKLSSVTKVETLYAPEYTDAEQTSARTGFCEPTSPHRSGAVRIRIDERLALPILLLGTPKIRPLRV
jgi:hypothetical protein